MTAANKPEQPSGKMMKEPHHVVILRQIIKAWDAGGTFEECMAIYERDLKTALASLAQPAEAPAVADAMPEPTELASLVRYLRDNDCPTQNGDAGKMALWDARQRAADAIEKLDTMRASHRAEVARLEGEVEELRGVMKFLVDTVHKAMEKCRGK